METSTNYAKQPKNLKRVSIDNHRFYFKMNVTKKRMLELLNDPKTEVYQDRKHKKQLTCIYSNVFIETNSVWYDENGKCYISDED